MNGAFGKRFASFQEFLFLGGIAWDIIAPRPEAGKKRFRERESLPAYEGIREGLAMAA